MANSAEMEGRPTGASEGARRATGEAPAGRPPDPRHGLEPRSSHPATATCRAVVGSVRCTDVEAKYRWWKREVARQAGERPQEVQQFPFGQAPVRAPGQPQGLTHQPRPVA
jgi:hypothetical protein